MWRNNHGRTPGADKTLWLANIAMADNINNFTVPYKGQIISFEDLSLEEWDHIIILLLLEKCDLKLGDWKLDLNDPTQISRLKGLIKYKILSMFYTYEDLNKNGQPDQQDRAQKMFKEDLEINQ